MSPHSDTISWFPANQSLLFLLNATYLVEKQQIPILTGSGIEPTTYRIRHFNNDYMYIYIYIYVWKLNQTVLELDFRAVKFLFFPAP